MSNSEKKKVGRPKAIKSPELMWQYFQDYKKEVKSNPFIVKDWVGKDAEMVYREKEKPLTMEGFEEHCFENGIISDLSDYFENKDDRYSEFIPICSRIRNSIRKDQIEGGMANMYNASITQRLNSLADKKEIDADVKQEIKSDIDYSKLSDETLKELLNNSQNKG